MEVIIATIITGVLTFAGVLVTNIFSNRKVEFNLDKQQAIMQKEIENLTAEVKKHNSFAERIPVIEEQMKVANHRITDLEIKVNK